MNATSTHLTVDLGASSGRVLAAHFDGRRLSIDEVHRFNNGPVQVQDQMHWNLLGLWQEIQTGLARGAASQRIDSIGVDTWGVDYVLLDKAGRLVGPCYHYRDKRTRNIFDAAFARASREQIFSATGLQFMEFNTVYQLLAAKLSDDRTLDIAHRMLMLPDFFHWLLTGIASNEYSNASTTQLLDPFSGNWAFELIQLLGLPSHLFHDIAAPGSILGPVSSSLGKALSLSNVPIVLPATHDTGSAVVAVPAAGFSHKRPDWCYISSGTWSLMGCELPRALINDTCSRLNFTNEGGVENSTRLLKNIGGLWLFQQCRASLQRRGRDLGWDAMIAKAEAAPRLQLLVDPDAPDFVAPEDMFDAISGYAKRTGQSTKSDDAVILRGTLEGLALRYRQCLAWLEELSGCTMRTIHVVGGGSQNRLLCQMTADACGRLVVAGPVEATALGNALIQLVGLGRLDSIANARQVIRDSFAMETFEPRDMSPWDEAAEKFNQLLKS